MIAGSFLHAASCVLSLFAGSLLWRRIVDPSFLTVALLERGAFDEEREREREREKDHMQPKAYLTSMK